MKRGSGVSPCALVRATEQGTLAESGPSRVAFRGCGVLLPRWRHLFLALASWLAFSSLAGADDSSKLVNLKVHGYFRFRGDILQNFGMDVAPRESLNSPISSGRPGFGFFPFYHPISAYPSSADSLQQTITSENLPRTLSYANMRFRLLTELEISSNVQIHTTFDFLDNIVLGSTPRGDAGMLVDPFIPLIAFSDTQVPPTYGANGFLDGVRIRHLYSTIRLPFGQLRVGRMPSMWGLGMLANSGMQENSEVGDSVDRVMFITKLFNHYIIPAFDFVATGPNSSQQREWWGQAFDMEQGDNAHQAVIAIARRDLDNELAARLDRDEFVFNYGAYFVYRWQNLTYECLPDSTCVNEQLDPRSSPNNAGRKPHTIRLEKRGAQAFIPDVWLRFQIGRRFRLEMEWVFVIGSIEAGPNTQPIDFFQWGGALEFEYNFQTIGLKIGLNMGVASGDKDFFSRWGFRLDTEGALRPDKRGKVFNFKFDPDYQIDMILWREMFGTVTNAFYVKPHVTYNFFGDAWGNDGLGLQVAGIYSMALEREATLGLSEFLGVELNAALRYASSEGYAFTISYGILFPLPGMSFAEFEDRPNGTRERVERLAATIAQRIQFRLFVKF